MGLEIERRFLVKNDKWKNFITKKTYIEQGYLSKNLNDWIVRIRFNGMDFKIALKKHIKNFTNFEFEYLIPQKDGEKILSNLKHIIKKERYSLEVDKKTWILDCFKDKNYPLEIAEIEFKKETEDLNLPSFLSKEITGISIFSNVSLATYPISEWGHEDLITLNES